MITRPENSLATIEDPTEALTSFIPDEAGLYVAQLIVHDASLSSNPDTSKITIEILLVNHNPQSTNYFRPDNDNRHKYSL